MTFITSGMRPEFITVAVRTDPSSEGAQGISLLAVDGDAPRLGCTELKSAKACCRRWTWAARSAITDELLDVVAGCEALRHGPVA